MHIRDALFAAQDVCLFYAQLKPWHILSHWAGILQDMVIAFIMTGHIVKWGGMISPEVQSFFDGMSHSLSVRAYMCVCVC